MTNLLLWYSVLRFKLSKNILQDHKLLIFRAKTKIIIYKIFLGGIFYTGLELSIGTNKTKWNNTEIINITNYDLKIE